MVKKLGWILFVLMAGSLAYTTVSASKQSPLVDYRSAFNHSEPFIGEFERYFFYLDGKAIPLPYTQKTAPHVHDMLVDEVLGQPLLSPKGARQRLQRAIGKSMLHPDKGYTLIPVPVGETTVCLVYDQDAPENHHFGPKQGRPSRDFFVAHELMGHCSGVVNQVDYLNLVGLDEQQVLEIYADLDDIQKGLSVATMGIYQEYIGEVYADVVASIALQGQPGHGDDLERLIRYRNRELILRHDWLHWSVPALKVVQLTPPARALKPRFAGDHHRMAADILAKPGVVVKPKEFLDFLFVINQAKKRKRPLREADLHTRPAIGHWLRAGLKY